MYCDINATRIIRDALQEKASVSPEEAGTFNPNGESLDLAAKFFRRLSGMVRNPDAVVAELNQRQLDLSVPFHRNLRKEMGETVYVKTPEGEKEFYLLGSHTVPNAELTGGIEVVLKLAPADNIASTKNYRFGVASDQSLTTDGSPSVVIDGAANLFQKAYVKTVRRLSSEKINTVIDNEGDRTLSRTLKKMVQGDKVLGSAKRLRNGSSLRGYEKVANYEHGNIDHMKEMMVKLHVLGHSKATDSQLAYYNSLFDLMHPRFFNQMELFLKKNGADAYGEVHMDTKSIYIRPDTKHKYKRGMSEAEVYVHEVIHTMTVWALSQTNKSVTAIKTQLNHAMETLLKETRWSDLLDKPVDQSSKEEIKQAKEMHEYIFAGKNASAEFIAHVLTNPKVMELAKKAQIIADKKPMSLFARIADLVGKLFSIATGKFNFRDNDTTVYDKVHSLAFQLAEVNNQHLHELDKMNPVGKAMDALADADNYVAGHLNSLKNAVKDKLGNKDPYVKLPRDPDSLYQNAKFYVQLGVKALTNPVYKGFAGRLFSAWGMKPNGTVREIARSFMEKGELFRLVEFTNLLRNRVDAARNGVVDAASRDLKNAFSRRLSHDEDTAITRVLLHTNLSGLRYKRYGRNAREDGDTVKLLTDKDYRYEQQGRVKAKIKNLLKGDEARTRWTTAQAVSLGYYLATGKGNIAMNFNGRNIAIGLGTEHRYEYDPYLADLVEELATLESLDHVSQTDKDLVAELIKTEKKGIAAITDAYEAYRRNSEEHLFKKAPVHRMLGHTAELTDDTVDVTIAPASKENELRAKGFILQAVLEPKHGDTYTSPMALYTTGTWGKAARVQGTVGLGKLHVRGTTMRSLKRQEDPEIAHLLHQRDFAKVQTEAIALHRAMMDGTFDAAKATSGLAPVYDDKGSVVDYRYMMSKENKRKLLGLDERATQVLPKSSASIVYELRNDRLNSDALDLIKKDMRESWESGTLSKDGMSEFTLIGPKAPDPLMRELYAMLPESYKTFINSRSDKTMAVRTELMGIYFGNKMPKLSNAMLIKHLPQVFKSAVDIVEGIWQSIIKVSKGAILLKMPLILVHNLWSNIRFQMNTGSFNPVELLKDYKDSTREVNEYLEYNRRAIALRLDIDNAIQAKRRVRNTKELDEVIRKKKTELGRLEGAIENNPAKELFDLGLYQSHVEDIDSASLGEANRLVKYIDQKLDKAPPILRKAADIAYLTHRTSWHKAAQEVLQRTDMITRLVDSKRDKRHEVRMANGELRLPLWWREHKGEGYPEKKVLGKEESLEFFSMATKLRHQRLLDNYINYTLPNGPTEEYLNSMGVLMFTKYLKRIQPVIVDTAMNHPIKTALSLLSTQLLPGDLIQEQALMARTFDPWGGFSMTNMVTLWSPMFHLDNVLTPPIVKEELRMGLF